MGTAENAPVESDYKAVPEMRGAEQIGVTFERKDAPVGGGRQGEQIPNDCMECGTINCPHNGKSNIANCHFWMSPDMPEQRASAPQSAPTGEPFLSGQVAELRRKLEGVVKMLEDDGLKESVAMECSDEAMAVEMCRTAIYHYCATVVERIKGIK